MFKTIIALIMIFVGVGLITFELLMLIHNSNYISLTQLIVVGSIGGGLTGLGVGMLEYEI